MVLWSTTTFWLVALALLGTSEACKSSPNGPLYCDIKSATPDSVGLLSQRILRHSIRNAARGLADFDRTRAFQMDILAGLLTVLKCINTTSDLQFICEAQTFIVLQPEASLFVFNLPVFFKES